MSDLPTVLAERRSAVESELELLIAEDHPCFEGHFPGQPILPGVVQIAWAVHFAAAFHGLKGGVHTLEQIKFRRPILPGAHLTLRLTPSADRHKLKFEFRDAEHSYSSGTLDYGIGA